jgi:hypothetical protein
MTMPRSHVLNIIPREEWCARFVTAWTGSGLPKKDSPFAEAHTAYQIAGMLFPEEAATIVAEVRSAHAV